MFVDALLEVTSRHSQSPNFPRNQRLCNNYDSYRVLLGDRDIYLPKNTLWRCWQAPGVNFCQGGKYETWICSWEQGTQLTLFPDTPEVVTTNAPVHGLTDNPAHGSQSGLRDGHLHSAALRSNASWAETRTGAALCAEPTHWASHQAVHPSCWQSPRRPPPAHSEQNPQDQRWLQN